MASFAGFRDLFGYEARKLEYISSRLSELFQLWGYERIELSIIENRENFSERIVGGSPWPEWDKKCSFALSIGDYQSSYKDTPIFREALLVPEGTISVSRWLASQINRNLDLIKFCFPLKIFYITPCFRNEPLCKLSSTKARSFNQVGVEIIGASNCRADLETMLLIVEGIKTLGVKASDINIRIGDIRIFNSLCRESGIQTDDIIPLKEALDASAEFLAGDNISQLERERIIIRGILDKYNLSRELKQKWDICLGGYHYELTPEESRILGYPDSVSDLNYLTSQMRQLGVSSKIDLAVVRSHEYYTAVVFEVDVQFGDQVIIELAGGGRYNKLIGKFLGEVINIPAIGFAYGLERLCRIFSVPDNKDHFQVYHWLCDKALDIVIYSPAEKFIRAIVCANRKRSDFLRTDVFIGDYLSEESVRCYSEMRGAKLEVII